MEIDRIKSLEQRLQKLRQYDVLLNIQVGSDANGDTNTPPTKKQTEIKQQNHQVAKETNSNTKKKQNSLRKNSSDNEQFEEFEISESEESYHNENETQNTLQQARDSRKKSLQFQKQNLQMQDNEKQNEFEENLKKLGLPKRPEQPLTKQFTNKNVIPQKQRAASQEKSFEQEVISQCQPKYSGKQPLQQQQQIQNENNIYNSKRDRPQTTYVKQPLRNIYDNINPLMDIDASPRKLPLKYSPKKITTPQISQGGMKIKKVDRVARYQQMQRQ